MALAMRLLGWGGRRGAASAATATSNVAARPLGNSGAEEGGCVVVTIPPQHLQTPAAAAEAAHGCVVGTPASPPPGAAAAECRICLAHEPAAELTTACGCTGTLASAHTGCVEAWVKEKGSLRCELCGSPYRSHLLPALEPLAAAAAARRKQAAQDAQEAQEARAAAALTDDARYKQRVKFVMLWILMVMLVSSTLAVGVNVLRYHLVNKQERQQQPNNSSPQRLFGLLPQQP